MEVGLASRHTSWEAFKKDFKDNPVCLISPCEIEYRTCSRDKIRLHNGSAYVNGTAQEISGWPLYESRLLKGDWLNQSPNAGLITIGDKKTGQLVLDFRDPTQPGRKLIYPSG